MADRSPSAPPDAAAPPDASLAQFARRHDPDRFLCALFAPPARREALFALVAFNHELARAREAARTPMAALVRLQWWRDAVEEAAAGKPPRRHEVAGPLARAIRAALLDPGDLLALADAREAEAEDEDAIPTASAFHAYLRGTAGALAVAAGRLLGAPPEALPGLQRRGTAYGAAGVLRAVPALARRGRCLLPAETLAAHGLTAAHVVRDPTAPALKAVAADLLAVEGGMRAPPPERLPGPWIAAALPAVLARRDARRLVAHGIPADAARGTADRLAVTLAALRGRC